MSFATFGFNLCFAASLLADLAPHMVNTSTLCGCLGALFLIGGLIAAAIIANNRHADQRNKARPLPSPIYRAAYGKGAEDKSMDTELIQ